MENPTSIVHKVEKPRDMAHQVDVPEEFKIHFIETAEKIGGSKNRGERIRHLSDMFSELDAYMQTLGFSKKEVHDKRERKASKEGKFDKGFIGLRDGKTKLVRDRIPSLVPREGSEDVKYRDSKGRVELLKELDAKLAEEASELIFDVKTREKRVEELADVYEVLYAILKQRDIQMSEINRELHINEVIHRRMSAPKTKI
jgi:predicted house-cleaning noncanonical NTP pyrophosphatase (MazG superfamily)